MHLRIYWHDLPALMTIGSPVSTSVLRLLVSGYDATGVMMPEGSIEYPNTFGVKGYSGPVSDQPAYRFGCISALPLALPGALLQCNGRDGIHHRPASFHTCENPIVNHVVPHALS